MWAADFADWLSTNLQNIYETSPMVKGTVDAFVSLAIGFGNLACRVRASPLPAANFIRRTTYAVANRAIVIAAACIAIRVAHRIAAPDGLVSWAVQTTGDMFIFAQQSLFVLELAVIGIGVQRDLSQRLRRPCEDEHDPLQQTMVRLCAPLVVSGIGCVMFWPSLFRGIALGCQIHDTALATRGFCARHRTARWVHDGMAYIAVGITMDIAVRACVPPVLAGAAVCLCAVLVTAVATCQPLVLVEMAECDKRPALQLPYMLSYQLVERARRAFTAGAFAPDLEKKTPVATTLLRVYRVFQHPLFQCVLPLELARPELHYLMAEIITPKSLEKALGAVSALLRASNSRLQANTTLYLPYVASLATGHSDPVIVLIQQILRDPANLATVQVLQEQLARRLGEARADSPPTLQQWADLGITVEQMARWDLNATLGQTAWINVDEPWRDDMGSLCLVDAADVPAVKSSDSIWMEVLSGSM